MRKWLALGLVLVGVVWGPFVYTELSRSPEKSHGRGRQAFGFFGDDEEEETAAEDPAAEAADPAAAPAAQPAEVASDKQAAPADKPATPEAEQAAADPQAQPQPSEAPTAKPGEPEAEEDEEEPRPTWPTALAPAFRKAFEAETRDGFWAQSAEPNLRAEFREAGVPETTLGEVACRKTICRVDFATEELEPEVENKLFDAMEKAHGTTMALDEKHSAAHAALYVLRPGYKLEQ